MRRHHLLSIVAALLVPIAGLRHTPARAADGIQPIQVPAAQGSGMYTLTADARNLAHLSWLEPAGQEHALRFSTLSGGRWSAPRTVARGANWFVNWADKPSVVAMPDGSLAAHWLVNNKTKQGSYGYGIRMAYSRDQGATWREVFSAGTDNVRGYSGFVSFLPGPEGLSAVYLTPKRQIPANEDDHTMTLNFVRFGLDGVVQSDRIVDADACSCCTTSIVRTARGPIVAYRDHEAGEIRDISIVRAENGRWTAPAPVHRDGWVINGCPTNGPVLDANGERVAAVWFTAAHNRPAVKLAFSDDAGAHFGAPVVVDGGKPIGWPAVVLLDDGGSVITWLESTSGGAGEVRLRRIARDGRLGPHVVVASSTAGRSTGIPQLVRSGDAVVVAWRDGGVKSARVPIPKL